MKPRTLIFVAVVFAALAIIIGAQRAKDSASTPPEWTPGTSPSATQHVSK